jgi:hypothetical protein
MAKLTKQEALIICARDITYEAVTVFLDQFPDLVEKDAIYDYAMSLGKEISKIVVHSTILKHRLGPNRPPDAELCRDSLAVDIYPTVQTIIENPGGVLYIIGSHRLLLLGIKLTDRIAGNLIRSPVIIGLATEYLNTSPILT